MPGTFHIKKGRDIPLKGAAEKKIIDLPLPRTVAVQPPDFKGIRPRLCVREGDIVEAGTIVFRDKDNPVLQVAAPVAGTVQAIQRGPKRVLEAVIINVAQKQHARKGKKASKTALDRLTSDEVIHLLLKTGLWPLIRQRPFSCVPPPNKKPKNIFIKAMNTEPLAPDMDLILDEKQSEFYAGLKVLAKLCDNTLHVCLSTASQSKALLEAEDVVLSKFSGPHPAGNVSTHIHHLAPLGKGETAWYVDAQDVARIGSFFLTGQFPHEKVIAVTGEQASKCYYARTTVGAPMKALLEQEDALDVRYLSGNVLTGQDVGYEGYVHFYDTQVTVLPLGGERELLGWLRWGKNKFTFSKTFASAFDAPKKVSLDTALQGGLRAIVQNNVYDHLVPLDIMVYFLIRAILVRDWEEAEALGLLECDPEDFALCSFACPSKTDVVGIIRQGLEDLSREHAA